MDSTGKSRISEVKNNLEKYIQQVLKENERGRQNQTLNNRRLKEYRKTVTDVINQGITEYFSPPKRIDIRHKKVQKKSK